MPWGALATRTKGQGLYMEYYFYCWGIRSPLVRAIARERERDMQGNRLATIIGAGSFLYKILVSNTHVILSVFGVIVRMCSRCNIIF